MPETTPPFETNIPKLTLPPEGFQSQIPEHLLTDVSESDKWIMQEISKNSQAVQFCVHSAIDTNTYVRRTNGKANRAEKDIETIHQDLATLKSQMNTVAPVINVLDITYKVLGYKITWLALAVIVLFLLGYNRDILTTIFKWFV